MLMVWKADLHGQWFVKIFGLKFLKAYFKKNKFRYAITEVTLTALSSWSVSWICKNYFNGYFIEAVSLESGMKTKTQDLQMNMH